jgi:hypothetical protein
MIAICVLRLRSSIARLGHARLISSSFVTTSPARSTSAIRMSSARPPMVLACRRRAEAAVTAAIETSQKKSPHRLDWALWRVCRVVRGVCDQR